MVLAVQLFNKIKRKRGEDVLCDIWRILHSSTVSVGLAEARPNNNNNNNNNNGQADGDFRSLYSKASFFKARVHIACSEDVFAEL